MVYVYVSVGHLNKVFFLVFQVNSGEFPFDFDRVCICFAPVISSFLWRVCVKTQVVLYLKGHGRRAISLPFDSVVRWVV